MTSLTRDLTKIYLRKKFQEYYRGAKLDGVRRLAEREFAFVPIDLLPDFVMHRHISFKTPEELKEYIISNVPAHIYYSSAYYERPDEGRMEDKGWKGADLIFDIDADHIPLKSDDFESALNRAKLEVKKLVMILERDFGVDEKDMRVYFSGGRGYHVHVSDDRYIHLGSAERREIVDYLLITNPRIFDGTYLHDSNIAGRVFAAARKMGADVDLPPTRRLSKESVIALKKLSDSIIDRLRVYIDAPVTADVKRLIRMPGSLHGKTGLRVTEVRDLESFDPLTDAVVFGDEIVAVKVIRDFKVRLRGESVKLRKGERVRVPEFVAVFVMCRGVAIYP